MGLINALAHLDTHCMRTDMVAKKFLLLQLIHVKFKTVVVVTTAPRLEVTVNWELLSLLHLDLR